MSMPVNESRLLIELEVKTDLWVCSRREPEDFYEEFAALLIDFNQIYRPRYIYSGYINAWADWLDSDWNHESSFSHLVMELKRHDFKYYRRYFKSYVSQKVLFLRRHRENEKRNRESLSIRLSQAISRYSKVEVVRVDLAYKESEQKFATVENFLSDLNLFRYHIGKRKEPFKYLVDYVWAMEQGETKGYHCHLMFVFNGHYRQRGWAIAKDIGELWVKITKQQGTYFNCHAPSQVERYRMLGRLGIGRIHKGNDDEVKNCLAVGAYLVNPEKEDQHLRVKTSKRMRTFG